MQQSAAGFHLWPVLQQLVTRDPQGLGANAGSQRTRERLRERLLRKKVVSSVCPYCAVGCAQLVYVKDEKIMVIEGDPRSPISEGCLCPKGAATFQLVTGSHREHHVLYRKPHGTKWERIPLEQDRVKNTRDQHWEGDTGEGTETKRAQRSEAARCDRS